MSYQPWLRWLLKWWVLQSPLVDPNQGLLIVSEVQPCKQQRTDEQVNWTQAYQAQAGCYRTSLQSCHEDYVAQCDQGCINLSHSMVYTKYFSQWNVPPRFSLHDYTAA